MKMMRVTHPTFINGSLAAIGQIVSVDEGKFGHRKDDGDVKSGDNLVSAGDQVAMPHVAVAPIAPTGPSPVRPQQLPAGTIATPVGFVQDGAVLVAEGGSVATASAENGEIEEEQTQRLGGEGSAEFDANAVRVGNLSGPDGVEARIAKLETEEQLDAVSKAEKDADGRQGVEDAITKRRADLTAAN